MTLCIFNLLVKIETLNLDSVDVWSSRVSLLQYCFKSYNFNRVFLVFSIHVMY